MMCGFEFKIVMINYVFTMIIRCLKWIIKQGWVGYKGAYYNRAYGLIIAWFVCLYVFNYLLMHQVIARSWIQIDRINDWTLAEELPFIYILGHEKLDDYEKFLRIHKLFKAHLLVNNFGLGTLMCVQRLPLVLKFVERFHG